MMKNNTLANAEGPKHMAAVCMYMGHAMEPAVCEKITSLPRLLGKEWLITCVLPMHAVHTVR